LPMALLHWLPLLAMAVGTALVLAPVQVFVRDLAAVRPTFRFAPVTGVIIILIAPITQLSPLEAAMNRLIEILEDADFRWWGVFAAQLGFAAWLWSEDSEYAKLLLGMAIGQWMTAKIGPVR